MKRCSFRAFLILALGLALLQLVAGQDLISGVDPRYREFAHPEQDVTAAIARHDFRFIAVDRARKIVPGAEQYRRLQMVYGVKVVPQHLRLFPSASQNFSFSLRARAYAEQYNITLATYLLAHHPKS